MVGGVAAQRLHHEPSRGVTQHVQQEHLAAGQPVAAVRPDQQRGDRHVPDQLVEEGRLEVADHGAGPAVDHVQLVDLQLPGQRGGPAVQLVVEPVAEPADRLRQHDAGRGGVGEGDEVHPVPPAADVDAQRAERDGAPDAQAAVPDLERVDRMPAGLEVQLGVGDHVVDPAAEDAEDDCPAGDVADVGRPAAAGLPAPVGQPERDDDAGHDAQGVDVDRERPDPDHADRGARDGRIDAGHVHTVVDRACVAGWRREVAWRNGDDSGIGGYRTRRLGRPATAGSGGRRARPGAAAGAAGRRRRQLRRYLSARGHLPDVDAVRDGQRGRRHGARRSVRA